jgi:transposase-like protein
LTITDDRMALLELIATGGDAYLVGEMMSFGAGHLMDAELQARTGAAHGVRDLERLVQRNGYRNRAWDTRVGQIDLAIPRLRRAAFATMPAVPDANPLCRRQRSRTSCI